MMSSCSSANKRIRRSHTKRRCRRRWNDLPQDLLEKIVRENDVARVRAVCKSWRSCIPNPNPNLYVKPPSPFLASIPYPSSEEPEGKDNLLFAALQVVVVALHPLDPNNPNGGILKFKREKSGKLRLMSPLEDNKCISTTHEVVNLLDYHVKVLHTSHLVEDNNNSSTITIKKVVVSGDSICAIFHEEYDEAHYICYLGILKFGDEKWTKINGDFEDIAVYREKFFAMDNYGSLLMIDPLSLTESELVKAPSFVTMDYTYRIKYLVESLGDLFLVLQHARSLAHCIEVYKLDEVKGRWEQVENLGERIFFVGDGECSFSTSAKDFAPGVCKKWNCVYYMNYNSDGEGTVERGLFDMDSAKQYHFRHLLSDCPAAMDIFWKSE